MITKHKIHHTPNSAIRDVYISYIRTTAFYKYRHFWHKYKKQEIWCPLHHCILFLAERICMGQQDNSGGWEASAAVVFVWPLSVCRIILLFGLFIPNKQSGSWAHVETLSSAPQFSCFNACVRSAGSGADIKPQLSPYYQAWHDAADRAKGLDSTPKREKERNARSELPVHVYRTTLSGGFKKNTSGDWERCNTNTTTQHIK